VPGPGPGWSVHELMQGARGKNEYFCVLLWSDKHVDVYRVSDIRFQQVIGTVEFSESVWEELWLYKKGIVS
jgi:hypothetical protein